MDGLFSGGGCIKLDASSLFDDDESNRKDEELGRSRIVPNKFPDRPPIRYIPTENDSESLSGFDLSKGNEWHYPTGVEFRAYQFMITERCLYQNCLVCIPTGLGKTLIAAVILHNFLRWYPSGRVIFMAPTRPLVSQQMVACRDLTGLSISGKQIAEAVELTGTTPPQQRAAMWKGQHRAFFLTPQVIANDLATGICPANSISCIVIDEAHKATGNHAYCQVIRGITGEPYNHRQFRVVALSATPATDLMGAQAIIANLLISRLEVRTESSSDVRPYCHRRAIEAIVVCLDPQLSTFKQRLCDLASPPLQRLCERNALWTSNRAQPPDLKFFAVFTLIKAREAFIKQNQFAPNIGMVMRDFRIATCFARALQLLTQYGLRPAYQFLTNAESSGELAQVSGLQELVTDIGSALGVSESTSTMSQLPFVAGHPKLFKLRDVLVDHFSKAVDNSLSQQETRAIVFTQYRESVADIMHMLESYSPLLRPAVFVGQSSSGQVHSRKKNTQHDQLQVMKAFREGRVNILISTSIGEEGLDVGQVDLIVCYDAHKSPSRLIQRLGRTGRKRSGRVVVLLTEGREQSNFSLSMARSSTVHATLLQGQATRQLAFYPHNPRMVPLGINPVPVFWQPSSHSGINDPAKQKIHPDSIKKYALPHDNFRISPCRPSALLSLGQKDDENADTFSNRYSMNRRIKQIREDFQSDMTGPSKTTWNLLASLRLIELHRCGRTHAIYHATGIRKIDMTSPLSELIPSLSQLTQVAPALPVKPSVCPTTSQANPQIKFFRGLVSGKLMIDPHFDTSEDLPLPNLVSMSGVTIEGLNKAFEIMSFRSDTSEISIRGREGAILGSTTVIFDNGLGFSAPTSRKSLSPPRSDNLPLAKRRRTAIVVDQKFAAVQALNLNFDKKLRFGDELVDLFDMGWQSTCTEKTDSSKNC